MHHQYVGAHVSLYGKYKKFWKIVYLHVLIIFLLIRTLESIPFKNFYE